MKRNYRFNNQHIFYLIRKQSTIELRIIWNKYYGLFAKDLDDQYMLEALQTHTYSINRSSAS